MAWDLVFWHWFILAAALLILEALAPGAFFLWMGVAAFLVGGIAWLMPDLGWEYQLLYFSVFSVVAAMVGRQYIKAHPIETDQPTLNMRGHQYIGKQFTLDEPIVNGRGKLRVDDTTWKIAGPDCAAGSRVHVTNLDGVVLQVDCEED